MVVRKLLVVLAGLAFGVTAAVRIAPITPSLDIRLIRTTQSDRWDGFMVWCMARGAEPAEEISIEVVSGPVRLIGNTSMKSLDPHWRVSFDVQIERTGEAGQVLIVQKGSAPRKYPVDVPGSTR